MSPSGVGRARFFVDENDLALAKALAALRDDVVYPGHPGLPEVPRRTPDDVWLQHVGAVGLVVITRDARIRHRPAERHAWLAHRVRGFVLTGKASQSTAMSRTILRERWDDMEAAIAGEGAGPWMFAVTRSGLRAIALRRPDPPALPAD